MYQWIYQSKSKCKLMYQSIIKFNFSQLSSVQLIFQNLIIKLGIKNIHLILEWLLKHVHKFELHFELFS